MELVYLWVEDYKNIHQQGFNFSGRYRCDYDHKKNELTIDKNDDYVHIFPENINVTAIVGENGSGKSSLFEKLYSSFGTRFYIIFSNNQFEIYTSLDNITIINTTTKADKIDKGRFSQIHFSWDILHYEPVLDWYSYSKVNPNILLNMLGTFSHPEYIDLASYQNNSVIKYIQIFTNNKINIFSFSPNKINIKFPMKKNDDWDFENIKQAIENLKFPKDEVDSKKEAYFKTICEYIEKYLADGNHERNFTLVEYSVLLSEFEDMKEVLSRFPSFILDMYDNEISFFGLSHGERSVLLSNALIFEAAMSSGKQDILICLDEPDLSLHPEWQKKYINEIVNMFSKMIDKNFHFLITSHSPFILSDIPKENVIFLKDGEQVYLNIETFGANIHTLLSHGFFMQDGLMGEFAKSKINEIIEFHNRTKADNIDKKVFTSEYEKHKTQFWHTQSIIGEEYLKQVIKNHLIEIEKILLGKDEAKNAEIARVKAYLESLEND